MRTTPSLTTLILAMSRLATAADLGPSPVVEIRPAKAEYLAGEPIGIVLTVRNPDTLPVAFRFSYPFTFLKEIGLIRFDGGIAMPPLEPDALMLSGPINMFATEVPAGGSWSATLFLQNYLAQPPPGDHRVGYRFGVSYRMAGRSPQEGNPPRDKYPSVSAEGSMTIRVTRPDPAALDRIMRGYLKELFRPDPDQKPWRLSLDALGAFAAYDGPGIIPYIAAAIRDQCDHSEDEYPIGLAELLEILKKFRDRPDACQLVLGLLSSKNSTGDATALEWLAEGEIPVGPDVLASLLNRARERMASPNHVLRYLYEVRVKPTAALIEQTERCLGGEDLEDEVIWALYSLAKWGVPTDPPIRKALDRVADEVKQTGASAFGGHFLSVLGLWSYPLGLEAVGALMEHKKRKPQPAYQEIFGYILAVGVRPYRSLEPQIVAQLANDNPEVTLAALRVLFEMEHILTAGEIKALLERGDEVRKATETYLRRKPAA